MNNDVVATLVSFALVFGFTYLIMAWSKRKRRDDYRDLMRKYYRGRKHFAD